MGNIWLTGCVTKNCLVEYPFVELRMFVVADLNSIQREQFFYMHPSVDPIPVDGLFSLKRKEEDKFFLVSIQIGDTRREIIKSCK